MWAGGIFVEPMDSFCYWQGWSFLKNEKFPGKIGN